MEFLAVQQVQPHSLAVAQEVMTQLQQVEVDSPRMLQELVLQRPQEPVLLQVSLQYLHSLGPQL
jgi:hypothetical protein